MRKIYLVLVLALFTTTARAQGFKKSDKDAITFKKFKFDLSLGFAMPDGKGSSAGVLISLEPRYAVSPSISVGLRNEFAIVARGAVDGNGNILEADVKAQGSYLLTGDYYFNQKPRFRPFAGVGIGSFSIVSIGGAKSSKFGEMLRVGFETGHLRMGLEYNIVPKTSSTGTTAATSYDSKNGYLGLKLGVCLGGGKK